MQWARDAIIVYALFCISKFNDSDDATVLDGKELKHDLQAAQSDI